MLWKVEPFPRSVFHVFLSHSGEDKDALVRPVYNELKNRKYECFIDVEDFYHGRGSLDGLRAAILDSRHVVIFITDNMLQSSRGWCPIEMAYAELLELSFHTVGAKLLNTVFPLFLVPRSDARIGRSVWTLVRDQGLFYDPSGTQNPVEWCVASVIDFLARALGESRKASDLCKRKPELADQLKQTPGLFDRVTKFQPRLPKL